MSNPLTVTKTLSDTGWTITASLDVNSTIPKDIFAYLNTGTTTLGTFQGVINVGDLNRLVVWTGSIVPIFANKYVRYSVAIIAVPQTSDVDAVIATLKTSVQLFSTAFQATQSSTQIFTIT
jgi:hypothetical protein